MVTIGKSLPSRTKPRSTRTWPSSSLPAGAAVITSENASAQVGVPASTGQPMAITRGCVSAACSLTGPAVMMPGSRAQSLFGETSVRGSPSRNSCSTRRAKAQTAGSTGQAAAVVGKAVGVGVFGSPPEQAAAATTMVAASARVRAR